MRNLPILLALLALPVARAETFFVYDKAEQRVPVSKLENPLFYDGSVAADGGTTFLTWLEFEPGKGDVVWFCTRDAKGKWAERQRITAEAGDYANPRVTLDAGKNVWVSYEAGKNGAWHIFVEKRLAGGNFSAPFRVSAGAGANLHHHTAASPQNGIWVVWQGDRDGQFDVFARQIFGPSEASQPLQVSTSPRGDWHPSVTVTPDDRVVVAWDSFDGQSYNVRARELSGGQWGEVLAVTSSTHFNANAQIASDRKGRVWITWEEDGPNWGGMYRPRIDAKKDLTRMSDEVGSLHRFRKLHLAELSAKNRELRVHEIPQPSFAEAARRSNLPAGIQQLGVFYQSPQLAVDGQDRLWLVYRHFYTPLMGISPRTHVQGDWGIYASCLEDGAWSKLHRFEGGAGDALQAISVAPLADGISVAWTFGRTDRRNPQNWDEDRLAPDKVVHNVATKKTKAGNDGESGDEGAAKSKKKKKAAPKAPHEEDAPPTEGRGLAFGAVHLAAASARSSNPTEARTIALSAPEKVAARAPRPAFDFNGGHYELFYGDLHRHTDISLCFSPADGSMDDAYRYGVDAGPLDFLGVTDHTHDIAMGDPLSLMWQRIRKEVDRHALAGTFIPFYSYERSRGDSSDHNVISLRDDVLRPHTYPHPEFWEELDGDTLTIPHQPFFNVIVWRMNDRVHRPLMEIYQGFRNHTCEIDAQQALASQNELGFIASSDHLSTGASFACVWAEKPTRESVFRAMQARRTFAAMDKMVLRVTCGEHWMGEKFAVQEMPPLAVDFRGTADVQAMEVFVDGKPQKIEFKGDSASHAAAARFAAEKSLTGAHSFFVRVTQADGSMAWSSPMWIEIGR